MVPEKGPYNGCGLVVVISVIFKILANIMLIGKLEIIIVYLLAAYLTSLMTCSQVMAKILVSCFVCFYVRSGHWNANR